MYIRFGCKLIFASQDRERPGKRGDRQLDTQISLLDFLADCAGYTMLSELHQANRLERGRLACALEEIAPEDVPLRDWNDALDYLAGAPAEPTAAAARARLMECLRQSRA